MKNLKPILLVDDSEQDIELTKIALVEEGRVENEIIVAYDGEEALDYLLLRGKFKNRPAGTPAVILLDLKMPKVNGLEVLKIIKKNEKLKHVPVVIITSSNEERDIVASYEEGVNAYVVKPVDSARFMETMKLVGLFWSSLNVMPASP